MDGGSITLKCKDKTGVRFQVHIVQKVFWEVYPKDLLPGRMYLNEVLIDQRSDLEEMIVNSMENPIFLGGYEFREILREQIDYVRSESYLSDVNKIILKPDRK